MKTRYRSAIPDPIQRRPSSLARPQPPVIEATVTHEVRVVHEVHVAHDDEYRDRAWLRAAIALWVLHALLLLVVVAFELGVVAGMLAAG